jgi:hypothetical protein
MFNDRRPARAKNDNRKGVRTLQQQIHNESCEQAKDIQARSRSFELVTVGVSTKYYSTLVSVSRKMERVPQKAPSYSNFAAHHVLHIKRAGTIIESGEISVAARLANRHGVDDMATKWMGRDTTVVYKS